MRSATYYDARAAAGFSWIASTDNTLLKTFSIQTLGCRVNQYESEQLASLLRTRGLTESDARSADLRVINTCSVTLQAAGKSRQLIRRTGGAASIARVNPDRRVSLPQLPNRIDPDR